MGCGIAIHYEQCVPSVTYWWCVLSEVRQSLTSAQQQYSQWSMLLDSDVSPEKVQSVGSELRNLIKSIDWDLEDLEQTISIPSLLCIYLLCVCVCVWVCVCRLFLESTE